CAGSRQSFEEFLALAWGELFGIIEAGQRRRNALGKPAGRKHHRRRHHWARQRAAPRFVHAGDVTEALFPAPAFPGKSIMVSAGAHVQCREAKPQLPLLPTGKDGEKRKAESGKRPCRGVASRLVAADVRRLTLSDAFSGKKIRASLPRLLR